MIRLLPLLLLIGCSDLDSYPATTTPSPGTDPPVVNDRDHEFLLDKGGGYYIWKIGELSSITVTPAVTTPLTFKVRGAPDWMTINTNFPGKNILTISGTPTFIGRYEINIRAYSSSGYDDAFCIVKVVNPRPAAEG
jgi:hypothetical protein